MKRIMIGMGLGIVAGVLDVIPMVLQKLTWDANMSAFTLWVISGFLIAVTDIKVKPVLKGIMIPFLVLAPSAILIGWKEPFSLVPITVMTVLLGGLLGFLFDKLANHGSDN